MKIIIFLSLLLLTSCSTIRNDCTLLNGCKFENGNTFKVYPDCELDNVDDDDLKSFTSNPNSQTLSIVVIECWQIKAEYKFK